MKFSSFKKWLNEKFTENDEDPIKSMGIGAKIIYYELEIYNAIPSFTLYFLILSGNTYQLKNIIKKYDFQWSDSNKGWKSKHPKKLEVWQELAPEIFKEIEKNPGYVVKKRKNPNNPNSPDIEGWGTSEYPIIKDGEGQKIYVSVKGHYLFPYVLFSGKGTYTAKEFLKYFNFHFEKQIHSWMKSGYNKNEIDEIVNYLKQHNYKIIDNRKD